MPPLLVKNPGLALRAQSEYLLDYPRGPHVPAPYFALTGMRARIPLVHDARMWTYFAAILVVGVVGKFGGAFISARFSGSHSLCESAALGILLNTRGLVELIVLNVGLEVGVISPPLFSILVLMAIVTTMATTPLLDAVYPASLHTRET